MTEPTETTFKPGDVVMLKSGGPAMTVVDIGQHTGRYFCKWKISDGKVMQSDFPGPCLTTRIEPWL